MQLRALPELGTGYDVPFVPPSQRPWFNKDSINETHLFICFISLFTNSIEFILNTAQTKVDLAQKKENSKMLFSVCFESIIISKYHDVNVFGKYHSKCVWEVS